MAGGRQRRKEKQLKRYAAKLVHDAKVKDGTVEDLRQRRGWDEIPKENDVFETYYRAQNLVKSEEEFQEFMKALRTTLPASFRITSYFGGQAAVLRKIVDSSEFRDLVVEESDHSADGENTKALKCLDWYPNRLAYQLNVSRVQIRKSEVFQRLHNFLLSETEAGFISRQEAVSMIPPLVLDVKPHHRILDMCAAPGSKTAQLIELLHDSDSTTKGVVVANDIDNKRCYMLVHQAKRLHSPTCIITNHDASIMPQFFETVNGQKIPLKFDRILCDVPCSGDGTLRKNTDIWKSWTPGNGNNFHGIQVKIARRGLELLKKDGLMVYSTCSFNPLEDEAVIANLIRDSLGGVELVDVSQNVPGLKYIPGLETWTIMTRNGVEVKSPSDVEEKYSTQIRESMFPPKEGDNLNLSRCLRILPHLQDTGGFFVSVLRKTVDILPWESKSDLTTETEVEEPQAKRKKTKKDKRRGFKEDPFLFFDRDSPEIQEINKFYKINQSFPFDQLMYRSNEGKKRNIYFLTEAAKNVIESNEDHIRFINAGARVFNRNTEKDFSCGYRLVQEGLPTIFPYLDDNSIINLTFEDVKNIISEDNFPVHKLSDLIRPQVESLPVGSCILVYNTETDGQKVTVPICGWRGKTSLRPYIAKHEKIHFFRICGIDTLALEQESREKWAEKTRKKEERFAKDLKMTEEVDQLLYPSNGDDKNGNL